VRSALERRDLRQTFQSVLGSPWALEMLMIRPQPFAYMCGKAARTSRNGDSSIRRIIIR
jgi:hypothetical protein